MAIEIFTGVTGEYINNHSNSNVFFQPHSSYKDISVRVGSIFVAPITYILTSGYVLLNAAGEFGLTIFSLFNGSLSEFAIHAKAFATYLVETFAYLIIAAVSPILNLIDTAGSILTMFASPSHHQHSTCYYYRDIEDPVAAKEENSQPYLTKPN